MKKLILLTVIVLGLFATVNTEAQISVRINISSQPVWGPVGYDYAEYYYIPEIEAYYYVPRHKFIFFEGNRWVSYSKLPSRCHDIDLYRVEKVVINEPKPYLHHEDYRVKYVSHRGRYNQPVIRDTHEERYFEIKDHPEHYRWKEIKRREKEERKERRFKEHGNNGNGNGHGNGNGRGHDRDDD